MPRWKRLDAHRSRHCPRPRAVSRALPCLLAGALLVLAPFLHACSGPGASGSGADDDFASALSVEIDAFLEPYVRARSFSGTVMLVRGDSLLHHRGYGSADHPRGIANGPGTRFLIGSISKSYTAAGILLLAERGQLALDDPIGRFVADFPHPGVTIEQLLSHTSGLGRYVFQPDYAERSARFHTTRDLVEWAAEIPPAAAPGERYGYSNANYAILAHIIERISGTSYGAFLENEILGPLDLASTGDAGAPGRTVADLAVGHHPVRLDELQASRPFDYSAATGAGSLYSSTGDLVRWYRARAAGRLLGEETRQRMAEQVGTPLGYAWTLDEAHGRDVVALGGWDGVGFGALLVHYVDEDLTVVVLSNLNMSSIAGTVADNVAAIAFGDGFEPLEIIDRPQVDAEILRREYAGVYRYGDDFYVPGATLTLIERDGQLLTPAAPPAPEGGLLPLADGSFIHRQQWLRVEFERGDDGSVTGIRYDRFQAVRER